MRDEHMAMPLVSAACEFLAPAAHGDRCEVRSRIARFGGKSFVVAHDIVRNDGVTLAKAQEKRVWGRYVTGRGPPLRAALIPQDVKQPFLNRNPLLSDPA